MKQTAEHPARIALVSIIGAALAVGALVAEHRAHAAEARTAFATLAAATDQEPTDTLVVMLPTRTLIYTGTLDTLSTSVQRVDFGASDGDEVAAIPRSGWGRGAYDVTVNGPEGFSGDGCALVRLDLMAGAAHVYLRCPGD